MRPSFAHLQKPSADIAVIPQWAQRVRTKLVRAPKKVKG